MVRKSYHTVKADKLGGNGKGSATIEHWLAGGEACPNLNLMCTIHLEPGGSVSDHGHVGEAEVYRILSGTGEYHDNGANVSVGAGDVVICYDNETHGLVNTGKDDIVFDAIIIKG